MSTKIKKRASGRAEVKAIDVKPHNQNDGGPTLYTLDLTENFHGDIEGENQARSLRVVRSDGSGTYVGVSRVIGYIADKSGSFVLQVCGTFTNKRADGQWFVVPGSGIGELKGLEGEGGFTMEFPQPGKIWLDYWFE